MAEILFSFQKITELSSNASGNVELKYKMVCSVKKYWDLIIVVKAFSDFHQVKETNDLPFAKEIRLVSYLG